MLPLILHRAIGLELLQVMPDGVQGQAQTSRKLLGGKPIPPLQLDENHAARTAQADRQGTIR
jgi:hypothetical protein